MANTSRIITLTMVAVMVVAEARSATADQLAGTIVLHVVNGSEITAADLRQAQSQAASLYQAIGVALIWVNDGVFDTADPPGALHLHVALLSKEGTSKMLTTPKDLGGTVLANAPPASRRIFLFCERIAQDASVSGESIERVLGQVLAHEIGHFVLPGQGHSKQGIMRVRRARRARTEPAFTNREGELIRALLRAREKS